MLRAPEDIVREGFRRSRVVMMNEAHNGFLRCVRTRDVGVRILPTAHEMGVRHMAMEALHPVFANEANATRAPPDSGGYLGQPDMRRLMQTALDFGWTLVPYEAPIGKPPPDLVGADMMSMEFTNWREEEQARNLHAALRTLAEDARMLVWCGNGHLVKHAPRGPVDLTRDWVPMGYHFREMTGIDPFCIDQVATVFDKPDSPLLMFVAELSDELARVGGTAGYLQEDAPRNLFERRSEDAFLLSMKNGLE